MGCMLQTLHRNPCSEAETQIQVGSHFWIDHSPKCWTDQCLLESRCWPEEPSRRSCYHIAFAIDHSSMLGGQRRRKLSWTENCWNCWFCCSCCTEEGSWACKRSSRQEEDGCEEEELEEIIGAWKKPAVKEIIEPEKIVVLTNAVYDVLQLSLGWLNQLDLVLCSTS